MSRWPMMTLVAGLLAAIGGCSDPTRPSGWGNGDVGPLSTLFRINDRHEIVWILYMPKDLVKVDEPCMDPAPVRLRTADGRLSYVRYDHSCQAMTVSNLSFDVRNGRAFLLRPGERRNLVVEQVAIAPIKWPDVERWRFPIFLAHPAIRAFYLKYADRDAVEFLHSFDEVGSL